LRPVLQTAARLARTADPNTTPPYGTPRPPAQRAADERGPRPDPFALSGRDTLERLAARAGLRPAGSGRVDCPFGYADSDSAVRGLISTGLFDTVAERIGEGQSEKELAESLHPFVRADGTVRMRHVFRYVLAARP
jgi:hypothetical protein